MISLKRSFSTISQILVGLVCLGGTLGLLACETKKPTRGIFKLRVVALTSDHVGIPKVKVVVEGKELGVTDSLGIFAYRYPGKVGQPIRIKVLGEGEDNYFLLKKVLKIRKINKKWQTIPVKVNAFLQPAATDYRIVILSQTPQVSIFHNTKKIGVIRDAGGRYTFLHSDDRSQPGVLTLRFQAEPPELYKETNISKRIPLTADSHSYNVTVMFTPRPKKKKIRIARTGETKGSKDKKGKKGKGSKSDKGKGKQVGVEPRVRRGFRAVVVMASKGMVFRISNSKRTTTVTANDKGLARTVWPLQSWIKIRRATKKLPARVIEVAAGSGTLVVKWRGQSQRCRLSLLLKKIRNKISLEDNELDCLRKIKLGHGQYFLSQVYLARAHCQKKQRKQGRSQLQKLLRNPRNRADPYRALELGLALGRCRNYKQAIRFLKYAEGQSHRFSPADRSQNKRSLYRAMYTLYEQQYYRNKNIVDLIRSQKSAERLAQLVTSSQRKRITKEVARLKTLIKQKGSIED